MEADCQLALLGWLLLVLVQPSHMVSLEVFITSDQGSRKLEDPRSGFKAVTNTDLVFTCEVSGMEPSMVVQVLKMRIVVTLQGDRKQVFEPRTWPYLLTNRTSLSPALHETGRYRVTETSSGSLSLIISSTQPEDSGVWACRILKDGEEYMTTEVDVVILGPIQGMHVRPSTTPPKNGTYTSGDLLQSKTGRKESISCSIFISNWAPDVMIFIRDVTGRQPFRDVMSEFKVTDFPGTSFKQFSIGKHDSPLRVFLGKITYRTDSLSFTYKDHKRRLYCTAKGELPGTTEDGYMDLAIQFQPVEARCDPPTVFLPPGADLADLTCTVRANPAPEVSWMSGRSIPDTADITTKSSSDHFTSTLTLRGVNASFFGVYKMTAKNDLGQTEAFITLTEGKGSVSRCRGFASSATLVSLSMLFMSLLR